MKVTNVFKAENLIRGSVEVKWSRKYFVLLVVSIVLMCVSTALLIGLYIRMLVTEGRDIETLYKFLSAFTSSWMWSFILEIVSILLLIFSLSGVSNITMRRNALKAIDGYDFYEGIVDEVNGSKRYMSLHISANDENGEELSLNTKVFYDKYGRSGPSPYDYYRGRVLVGYNKVTDICVIICAFKENETFEACMERAAQ